MGGKGKRKIEMKRIYESERRFVTFCKRRKGMFKKAEELALLTGAHVAALVFSPALEKPHTCGDMMVIQRYINDTCADQLSAEPEIINVDAVLQMHASTNLEDINDLNVLTEMKSELMVIRYSLLQRLT